MPDFRMMFDKDYLYAYMLQGKEWTLEIERVLGGEITGEGGKKSKKPICWFKGRKKPLALNVTNCKTIASMYGVRTEEWIGKKITIYPSTTEFGNKGTVDCIRVRQGIPRGQASTTPEPDVQPPTDPEPGSDG